MSEDCSKKYNLQRTQETLIKKYGTTNIMESPGSLDKIKETNRKKYGSDFYTETDEFKEKTKETFGHKYGGHPTKLSSTQDKKKKTNFQVTELLWTKMLMIDWQKHTKESVKM
jgi:hypothetical protein